MMNLLAQSSLSVASSSVANSWLWYTTRASGIVALGLMILLMISGIGHVTGWTYKLLPPVRAWAVHKAMGIALALSVLVHIASLLLDNYIKFDLSQILVPFTSTYSNDSTIFGISLAPIAVAAGVVAFYAVFAVVGSSLDSVGWIRSHKRLWKGIHIASYAALFLTLVHALGTGSDFRYGATRYLLIGSLVIILIATLARLRRRSKLPKETVKV